MVHRRRDRRTVPSGARRRPPTRRARRAHARVHRRPAADRHGPDHLHRARATGSTPSVAVIMKGHARMTDHRPRRQIAFDPYDYAFQEDPYPVYARLRDEEPLHHNEQHDLWVLSRYADIQHAAAHRGHLLQPDGRDHRPSPRGTGRPQGDVVPRAGPARPHRIRSLVCAGVHAAPGARARPPDPGAHRALPRPALEAGSFDWIKDFAGRLPMDVISEMMGVPPADRDEVRRLADLLVHREEGVTDVTAAGIEAARQAVRLLRRDARRAPTPADRGPHQRAARVAEIDERHS